MRHEAQVLEEPQIPAEAVPEAMGSRRLRLCELALVVSVGFLASTVASFLDWWTGERTPETEIGNLFRILEDSLAISVLVYVLYRQGRSLRAIGFTARISDLLWGLAVWFFTYVMSHAVTSVLDAFSVSFPESPIWSNNVGPYRPNSRQSGDNLQ